MEITNHVLGLIEKEIATIKSKQEELNILAVEIKAGQGIEDRKLLISNRIVGSIYLVKKLSELL